MGQLNSNYIDGFSTIFRFFYFLNGKAIFLPIFLILFKNLGFMLSWLSLHVFYYYEFIDSCLLYLYDSWITLLFPIWWASWFWLRTSSDIFYVKPLLIHTVFHFFQFIFIGSALLCDDSSMSRTKLLIAIFFKVFYLCSIQIVCLYRQLKFATLYLNYLI